MKCTKINECLDVECLVKPHWKLKLDWHLDTNLYDITDVNTESPECELL